MGISYHIEGRYPGIFSSENGVFVTGLVLLGIGMVLSVATLGISSLANYELASPAHPFMMLLLPAATLLTLTTNRALRGDASNKPREA